MQEELARVVEQCKRKGDLTLILGGSHDLTFGHFLGIYNHLSVDSKKIKMGVINFDAHLDLRNYDRGPHSGSSFLQIADAMISANHEFQIFMCRSQ